LGVGHIHGQDIDAHAGLDSWLHRWEPRLKIAAGTIFVVGVVLLKSLPLAAAAFGLAALAVFSAGLPARFLAGRFLWVLPFLSLMFITLALGNGLPLSAAGLSFAALVCLKALTAVTVMVALLGTQPLQALFSALAHLRLPPLPLTALFLTYRYLFLFRDELHAAQRSLAARAFRPGLDRRSFRAFGELTGTVLLGALDRSERVHRAMSARGFEGRLPAGPARAVRGADLAKGLVSVAAVVLLVVLDRGLPI